LIDLLSAIKLSLAGCSPAEPASVILDNIKVKNTRNQDGIAIKNSLLFVHMKELSKKQPTFCPLRLQVDKIQAVFMLDFY
jgi:hypothetical protein